MFTPVNLSLWLEQQALPLAIIAAVILGTYGLLKFSAYRRTRRLTEQREGVTDQTFADYLEQFGIDPVISSASYRYLQDVQRVAFPILPTDALDEDLGLGYDDVEQTVRELTLALGRDWNPGLMQDQIVSVDDLVRLLQSSPVVARQSRAA
ncbi:hypothetical protein ACFQBQ_10705 [Granulicella cerasi]|uniref:Uncharacterized protein n=1 Tax=Granulicella cerasi TaxID=741063 RepID=A0ABW1ZBS5_9BACT|nr:hypothetical protein [Granulicella cerasi]